MRAVLPIRGSASPRETLTEPMAPLTHDADPTEEPLLYRLDNLLQFLDSKLRWDGEPPPRSCNHVASQKPDAANLALVAG